MQSQGVGTKTDVTVEKYAFGSKESQCQWVSKPQGRWERRNCQENINMHVTKPRFHLWLLGFWCKWRFSKDFLSDELRSAHPCVRKAIGIILSPHSGAGAVMVRCAFQMQGIITASDKGPGISNENLFSQLLIDFGLLCQWSPNCKRVHTDWNMQRSTGPIRRYTGKCLTTVPPSDCNLWRQPLVSRYTSAILLLAKSKAFIGGNGTEHLRCGQWTPNRNKVISQNRHGFLSWNL